MSNALICDTCTQVFPEGAEGSVSGNGTFTRTVDGVRKELQRRQDQCPQCAGEQEQRWNGARTLEPPKTVPPVGDASTGHSPSAYSFPKR
jgi:hypothetical protein